MSLANRAKKPVHTDRWGWGILLVAMLVTGLIYSTGLSGNYLFDDYPNIVDNHAVQPSNASLPSLVGAALSSSSSEFKRPLASLSFAANYLATGLNPYWMKLTNLVIHLLNGLLIFLLAKALLQLNGAAQRNEPAETKKIGNAADTNIDNTKKMDAEADHAGDVVFNRYTARPAVVASLIAASWMLLPINLTGVLYVVQRMESMANLFVLAGLIGYVAGRRRMLGQASISDGVEKPKWPVRSSQTKGFVLCAISVTAPTAIGLLAKETAVMLPLYAVLIEWAMFRFAAQPSAKEVAATDDLEDEKISSLDGKQEDYSDYRLNSMRGKYLLSRWDWRIVSLFLLFLALPLAIGLIWLLPGLLNTAGWATRNFTLRTRLLSESRIVIDYVRWTLLPTPGALSFYHDDFYISTGLLKPWTTLASIVSLATLLSLALWLRSRLPLVALGIALFLGCHLLTGTVIPLELVYEHRNYFASFGLMLAIVPLLVASGGAPFALPRRTLLAGLMLCWATLTALTSYAWGDPLRLAEDLAVRAPQSPRAEYELGRTYIIYSHYDHSSPFTKLAYAPLEKAAILPDSSILPEQALMFMNARMHLPIKDAWWDSLIAKLKARKATVQDESSLAALTECVRQMHCDLSQSRMMQAFMAALTHPNPSARLLANYGDYCWNELGDKELGLRMIEDAVKAAPNEPAYLITKVRMLAVESKRNEALQSIKRLQALNYGGRLNNDISQLRALPELK